MKPIIESAYLISSELKKLISRNAIDDIENGIYKGDNANYCISLFQENLINPNEDCKTFLYHLGQTLIRWAKNNLQNGSPKLCCCFTRILIFNIFRKHFLSLKYRNLRCFRFLF